MANQLDPELSGAPSSSAEVSIKDYLGVFPRRWPLIVVPAVLIFTIAGMLGFILPPRYEDYTTFKVLDKSFELEVYKNTSPAQDHKPLFASVDVDIKRAVFLDEIIQRIDLNEGFDYHDARDRIKLFEHVLQSLRVSRIESKEKGKDDVIAIKYGGRDPYKVAAFLNAIREKYLGYVTDRYKQNVSSIRANLSEALLKERENLNKAQDDLKGWSGDPLLIEPGVLASRMELREFKVSENLADQEKLEEFERLYERTVEEILNPGVVLDIAVAPRARRRPNPDFAAAKAKVEGLKREKEILGQKLLEAAPKMVEMTGRIALAEAELKGIPIDLPPLRDEAGKEIIPDEDPAIALRRRQSELKEKRAQLSIRIERRTEEIKELNREIDMIPGLRKEYLNLDLSIETAKQRVQRLERSLGSVQDAWDRVVSAESTFTETLRAPVPEEAGSWQPVFPKISLFLTAGLAVGLLVGIGLAFLAEFSSQTFVTTNQVKRSLPIPVLGEIGRLETLSQRRGRLRKRLLLLAVFLMLAGGVGWAHYCYFESSRQGSLPPAVFDIMKRIYGATR